MSGNPADCALDPATQAFVDATATPPYLSQMTPEDGRLAVDHVQDSPVFKPAVDDEWIEIEGGPTEVVRARIVRPRGATGRLPVVLHVHGGGWVFGNAHTHDRLVRELAVGAGAAVLFPEYDNAPEARYPTAVEQCYAAAQWITAHGAGRNLDSGRIAVCGDSTGGTMAIALSLLAKQRGDVTFAAQTLFYPATDASFDTPSYREFGEGYWLRRDTMRWFWDQYAADDRVRSEITVSPLRASIGELAGLPDTLIITAEADVLRDEGEQFAAKLRRAGVNAVNARFGGTVHDFVLLNALHETASARQAVHLAGAFLRAALAGSGR